MAQFNFPLRRELLLDVEGGEVSESGGQVHGSALEVSSVAVGGHAGEQGDVAGIGAAHLLQLVSFLQQGVHVGLSLADLELGSDLSGGLVAEPVAGAVSLEEAVGHVVDGSAQSAVGGGDVILALFADGTIDGTVDLTHDDLDADVGQASLDDLVDGLVVSVVHEGQLQLALVVAGGLQLGLGSENFSYRLRNGETVYAPEAIMTYSPTGLGTMSRHFHDFINHHIVPEKARERRPVVLNSWEAFYFNINENIMVDFAAAAVDCGMDMVIMDDGWFGARINDKAGLGDWFVNRNRFPDGLRPFVERVKATGVKFGIWVEPEMVNPDSELYRAHPDWVISCRDRERSLSRSQMVLDMSNPAVLDYLKASFTETFAGVPIDYFKWDMNRHISEPGSPTLAPEDQGSLEYRYMLGVYSLFDWFTKQYPDAMIENCSGGGGRYDPAMMYFTSQIWTSDNTSARDRVLIQYSSQLAYPASVMSCHVSNPKGNLRELDLKYKVAVGGILGYEFNVLNTPDEIKEEIRRQVARYRTFDHLIQFGTHYRLSSPYETGISAYYYQLDDEILLSAILTNGCAVIGKKKPFKKLVIRTADKNAVYRDAISGITFSGAQLRAGIEVGEFNPDDTGYDAKLWHFVKI